MALHTEPKSEEFSAFSQSKILTVAQYHIPLYFRFTLLYTPLIVFVFWAYMSLDDWACIFQSWISFASLGSCLSGSSSMVGWEVGGCSSAILSATCPSTTIICIFYRQGCPALKFLSVQTQCKTTQTDCSLTAVKWSSTSSSTSLTIGNAHIFSTSFRSFDAT